MSTFLDKFIIIPSPSTQDIINELEATNYEIEANAGPNAFDDLDNNIQKNNFEFITNSIKNEKIKNAFEISKFKLNNGLLPTCTSLEETMKLNEFNNTFQT